MDNAGFNSGSGPSGNVEEGDEQDDPSSSINPNDFDYLGDNRDKERQQAMKTHQFLKDDKNLGIANVESYDSDETKARMLFLKGVEMEKTGKLYEAIQYYKRAVQIVPDIEFKLGDRPKNINERPLENLEDEETEDSSEDDSDDTEIIEEGQLLSRIQKKVSKMTFVCTPKFTQSDMHISRLPLEILIYILKWVVSRDLDLRSLEIFGLVCRGFYLCARDPEIWRLACVRVWGLNCGSSPSPYDSWRGMFIERPRLNYNGCYISKTTYLRAGENSFQDQFYRPWHFVDYYRYIRFFPEGYALMLSSPDEPSACVQQLKNRTPKSTFMVGYFRLKDDKVTLVMQRQDNNRNTMLPVIRRGTRRRAEVENAEQTFHLELLINNHKSKRHCKLTWTHYSVTTKPKLGQESTCNFDLKMARFPPLFFSRVKSFTLESDQPLD